MNQPASITIVCQGCKTSFTPRKLVKSEGRCDRCPDSKWHIKAEYDVIAGDTGGADAATVGLNAIGIGLLATTGAGFVVSGGARESKSSGKSVAEVYDVAGDEVVALCTPPKFAVDQLAYFIEQREKEVQRNRMLDRGGSHCQACKILFVPSTDKPWTLMGACSRSCCAKIKGVASYSEIEDEINQSTQSTSAKLTEFKKNSRAIETRCKCGHVFDVPQMYQGTFRKCPSCADKTLVPLKS